MDPGLWVVRIAALAFAVGVCPIGALAQSSSSGGAGTELTREEKREFARLVGEGKEAYTQGEFERALPKFERAHEIYPAEGLLYRIAQCHERVGARKKAIEYYDRFLDARPNSSKKSKIEAAVAELKKERRVTVRVESKPPGARVVTRREGAGGEKSRGTTPLEFHMAPGTVEISLTKEGYGTHTESLEAEPASTHAYSWELRQSQSREEQASTGASRDGAKRKFPVLPAVIGGVGLATYGTLYALGSRCRSKSNPCAPSTYRPMAIGSYAGAGVAAVGFGTAAFLWLTDSPSRDGATAGLKRIRIQLSAETARVGIGGRF